MEFKHCSIPRPWIKASLKPTQLENTAGEKVKRDRVCSLPTSETAKSFPPSGYLESLQKNIANKLKKKKPWKSQHFSCILAIPKVDWSKILLPLSSSLLQINCKDSLDLYIVKWLSFCSSTPYWVVKLNMSRNCVLAAQKSTPVLVLWFKPSWKLGSTQLLAEPSFSPPSTPVERGG